MEDDDEPDEEGVVPKESQQAQPVEPMGVDAGEDDAAGMLEDNMDEVSKTNVSQSPDVEPEHGSSTNIASSQILDDSQDAFSTNLWDDDAQVDMKGESNPTAENMSLGNKDEVEGASQKVPPSKGWVDLPDDPTIKIPELEKKLASLRRQHSAVFLVINYLLPFLNDTFCSNLHQVILQILFTGWCCMLPNHPNPLTVFSSG